MPLFPNLKSTANKKKDCNNDPVDNKVSHTNYQNQSALSEVNDFSEIMLSQASAPPIDDFEMIASDGENSESDSDSDGFVFYPNLENSNVCQRLRDVALEKYDYFTFYLYQLLHEQCLKLDFLLSLDVEQDRKVQLIEVVNQIVQEISNISHNRQSSNEIIILSKLNYLQKNIQLYESYLSNSQSITALVYEINLLQQRHRNLDDINNFDAYFDRVLNKIIVSNFDCEQSLSDLIQICIKNLPMLDVKTAIAKTTTLFQEIRNSASKQKKDHILDLLTRLIKQSSYELNAYHALSQLFKQKLIRNIIRNNQFIVDIIIEQINQQPMSVQDPFYHYYLYSSLFAILFAFDGHKIDDILSKLHYTESKESARAFYHAFMFQAKDDNCRINFLQSLINSRKIEYFTDSQVIANTENLTVNTLNSLLKISFGHPKIAQAIVDTEAKHFSNKQFPIHQLLSLMLLHISQLRHNAKDPMVFARALFYLGINLNSQEQLELSTINSRDLLTNPLPAPIDELILQLNNLYSYAHSNDRNNREYNALYALITNKIIEMIRVSDNLTLKPLVAQITELTSHCLRVNKYWLNYLFSCASQIGEYPNGSYAVQDILNTCLSGSNPSQWSFNNLSERIFFMYCMIKYPIDEYIKWFQNSNPNHQEYINAKVPKTLADLKSYQKKISGYSILSKIGFNVLHNNQTIALQCVLDPPNNAQHVFEKVGTGQGKSLIIALSALHYATQGRKVHIFAPYEHLAKRDYKRFKLLFDTYGIKSHLISTDNIGEAISDDTKIIYSELKTYITHAETQIDNRMKDKKSHNTYDYFDLDVAFLDEFDSILKEPSLYNNYVYQYQDEFGLSNLKAEDIASSEAFMRTLIAKSDLGGFFAALNSADLMGMYHNWFNNTSMRAGSAGHDSLGKTFKTIGGERYELNNGRFYLKRRYIDIKSFLTSFKNVFGFSGSISENDMENYTSLYPNSTFVDIPNYYGTSFSKVERRNFNIDSPLTPMDWQSAIEQDVFRAFARNQPVLIFSDINNKDEWNYISAMVTRLARQHNKIVHVIDDESKITDDMISAACQPNAITISSQVAARGTDFSLLQSNQDSNTHAGLHVLVTYPPENSNGTLDNGMLTQMLGRTGRMNTPGSYSVIVKNKLPSEKSNHMKLNADDTKKHKLINLMYHKIKDKLHNDLVSKKWLLFNLFLEATSAYPSQLEKMGTLEQQANFVANNILMNNRLAHSMHTHGIFSNRSHSTVTANDDIAIRFGSNSSSAR